MMKVGILFLCGVCLGEVGALPGFIHFKKRSAHEQLNEAGSRANLYVNKALNEMMEVLTQKYGPYYIRRETELTSQTSQFLAGVEPVLTTGVTKVSRSLNTTLDQLYDLLNKGQDKTFTEKPVSLVTSQVDGVLVKGRRSTDEASIELYGSILQIVGEYFKGVYGGQKVHMAVRSGRRYGLLPEARERLAELANNTFNIVDMETKYILKELDDIGEAVKQSFVETWEFVKWVRPQSVDITSLIQHILEINLSTKITYPGGWLLPAGRGRPAIQGK